MPLSPTSEQKLSSLIINKVKTLLKLNEIKSQLQNNELIILGDGNGVIPGGVDDTPTEKSLNYITSDGIKKALDTKQPTGEYATKTELNEGLKTKQPTGDYATKDELPKIDKTLTNEGQAADAKAVNDEFLLRVKLPKDNPYGTKGQVAVSDGAGGITWVTLNLPDPPATP